MVQATYRFPVRETFDMIEIYHPALTNKEKIYHLVKVQLGESKCHRPLRHKIPYAPETGEGEEGGVKGG